MMTDNHKGLVFNIQKFSIQDGPGIRTTVFMKGCPLSCPWCSNPEGLSPKAEIITNDRKCIGCMKCADVCPVNAISFNEETGRVIDWEICNNCLECAEVCPSKSIEASGQYMTVDEVLEVVNQDAAFYRNSGGGVSVSGGEALLQWEFVRDVLKKSREAGYHTVLDTTAYCSWENIEPILKYVDLVLVDIKHMDSKAHKEKTGVPNELILSNIEKVAPKAKVWIRIPLIPGFNDSEENLRQSAELASRIKAEKVSLLPYHEYGKQKYERVGRKFSYSESEILAPDSEIVVRSKEIIESYGLEVAIGG